MTERTAEAVAHRAMRIADCLMFTPTGQRIHEPDLLLAAELFE